MSKMLMQVESFCHTYDFDAVVIGARATVSYQHKSIKSTHTCTPLLSWGRLAPLSRKKNPRYSLVCTIHAWTCPSPLTLKVPLCPNLHGEALPILSLTILHTPPPPTTSPRPRHSLVRSTHA